MKIYDGAMLHGVNKQNVSTGELGEVVSLDLGMIPEEVIDKEVVPLIEKLSDILGPYHVYPWLTISYRDFYKEDTENKDSE